MIKDKRCFHSTSNSWILLSGIVFTFVGVTFRHITCLVQPKFHIRAMTELTTSANKLLKWNSFTPAVTIIELPIIAGQVLAWNWTNNLDILFCTLLPLKVQWWWSKKLLKSAISAPINCATKTGKSKFFLKTVRITKLIIKPVQPTKQKRIKSILSNCLIRTPFESIHALFMLACSK